MMEIQNSKTVWVAWTNTDLTEGRGNQYPLCVAESKEAAERVGKNGGVMGSNCHVSAAIAVMVNNTWLIPGVIQKETKLDAALRLKREIREMAIAKAKAAGLSEDEIAALTGKHPVDGAGM